MKKEYLLVALLMGLGMTNLYAAKPTAKGGAKRIFCWEEQGRKICGDALPAHVTTDQQRQEINPQTGTSKTVAPTATTAPSALAGASGSTEQAEATTLPDMSAEEATRVQALVQAYESEGELLKSFEEEKRVSEQSLKDLLTQEKAAHGMLVQHLKTLSEKELMRQTIAKGEHEELMNLRQSLVQIRNMKKKEQEKQKNMSQNQARLLELYKQVKSSL